MTFIILKTNLSDRTSRKSSGNNTLASTTSTHQRQRNTGRDGMALGVGTSIAICQ
ncbi:MAG: hypothetical protein V7L06_02790 [Nostoc sp.]